MLEVDADDGSCVHHRRFDQYKMWGNHLGNGYVYREDVNMHFPKAYHEDLVVPLFGHACGLTGCEFTNDRDSYISEKEAANRGGENDVKRKQPPQGQHRECVCRCLSQGSGDEERGQVEEDCEGLVG